MKDVRWLVKEGTEGTDTWGMEKDKETITWRGEGWGRRRETSSQREDVPPLRSAQVRLKSPGAGIDALKSDNYKTQAQNSCPVIWEVATQEWSKVILEPCKLDLHSVSALCAWSWLALSGVPSPLVCGRTPFLTFPQHEKENSVWGSPEQLMCPAHHSGLVCFGGHIVWVCFYWICVCLCLKGDDRWGKRPMGGDWQRSCIELKNQGGVSLKQKQVTRSASLASRNNLPKDIK